MKQFIRIVFLVLLAGSCKNDTVESYLVGNWKWVIQYADDPYYNSTPQSTGIEETLTFSNNNRYTLMRNSVIVNSGTYKLSTQKNQADQNVSAIIYTNPRVTDSVDYYTLENNNDSLFFSHDLIGTIGSGSRHYGRQ